MFIGKYIKYIKYILFIIIIITRITPQLQRYIVTHALHTYVTRKHQRLQGLHYIAPDTHTETQISKPADRYTFGFFLMDHRLS